MGKIHISRLKKRYGDFTDLKDLMSKIIDKNSRDITKAVVKQSGENIEKENRRVTGKEKAINLPTMDEVYSKAVHLRKAGERGKLMTDNLRDKLTENLRDILKQDKYMRTRGTLAGTMKDEAIKEFQDSIKATFENYIKVDPSYGVPANIRNIAVTEMRVVTNNTKHEYVNQILSKNENVDVWKTWRHNRGLSKVPRPAHQEMNGVKVHFNENFTFYDKKTKKLVSTPYPHHPSLSADESIGCSCEVVYTIERKKPEHTVPMYRHGA
jgi:hypothetical protein